MLKCKVLFGFVDIFVFWSDFKFHFGMFKKKPSGICGFGGIVVLLFGLCHVRGTVHGGS